MSASFSSPEVRESMEAWHRMVANLDLSDVAALMAPDAVFRSPAYWKPYRGAPKVAHILQVAMSIFEDFEYHREFVTSDGLDVVLEFSARIGDLDLKGIDMIGFNVDGLIERFEVMLRPMKSLHELADRMKNSVDVQLLGLAAGTTSSSRSSA